MILATPRLRVFPDHISFSPLAWLKLQWFCHAGSTEVGGFGISAENNLLNIENFVTVKQYTTPMTVRFDDHAVADLYDELIDKGLPVSRFARIWIHTHPCESAQPSSTDEETFERTFGNCDWAVMFIVSRTGQTYARLSFSAGPGGQVLLPTEVAWPDWPASSNRNGSLDLRIAGWRREFEANVNVLDLDPPRPNGPMSDQDWWDTYPWSRELDETLFETANSGAKNELLF